MDLRKLRQNKLPIMTTKETNTQHKIHSDFFESDPNIVSVSKGIFIELVSDTKPFLGVSTQELLIRLSLRFCISAGAGKCPPGFAIWASHYSDRNGTAFPSSSPFSSDKEGPILPTAGPDPQDWGVGGGSN